MYLIAGLGNQGPEYENTRHNLGFRALTALADGNGAKFTKKKLYNSMTAKISLSSSEAMLVMPLTFMNNSGEAIARICRAHDIAPDEVIIIHDEMDLEPGAVRIKAGGGTAGHNGLASVCSHLNSENFQRIRIGIGRPKRRGGPGDLYAGYVLSEIPKADSKLFKAAAARAACAAELIIEAGIETAMNRFNRAPGNEPA